MARSSKPTGPNASGPSETQRFDDGQHTNVGDLLRSQRLSRDLDLREVAANLHIRYPYLEAIEDGRLHDLPGPTYAIGFVRAYADFLGLSTEEVVARFKADSRALDAKAELVFPEPMPGSRVPGFALLFVGIVLGGLVYGGWLFVSSQDRPIADIIPAVPERLAALIEDFSTSDPDEAVPDTPSQSDVTPDEPAPTEETAPPSEEMAADAPEADTTPSEPEVAASPESSEPALSEPAAADPAPDEAEAPAAQSLAETAPSETPASDEGSTPAAESVEDVAETPEAVAPEAVAPDVVAPEADVPEAAEAPTQSTTPQPAIRTEEEIAAEAERAARQAASAADEAAEQAAAEVTASEPAPEPAPVPAPSTATDVGPSTDTTSPQADAQTADAATQTAPEPAPEPQPEPQPEPGAALPDVPSPDPGATATQQAAQSNVFGATANQSRVSITARVASWVEITGGDGQTLMARLLRAGETYRVPDRAGIRLVTGNAGGLEIIVDGARAPDIGPLGAVRRDVALDPAKLKAGVAGDG